MTQWDNGGISGLWGSEQEYHLVYAHEETELGSGGVDSGGESINLGVLGTQPH
jgi:hypothetical protein